MWAMMEEKQKNWLKNGKSWMGLMKNQFGYTVLFVNQKRKLKYMLIQRFFIFPYTAPDAKKKWLWTLFNVRFILL